MAAKPLIAIVGQTASGKTSLAIEIAQKYGGEIICADSRTVYSGVDISTAKPNKTEQQTVRHHLLDVVNPDEPFSAADFQRLANKAIKEIVQRDNTPIIAGGSGLFVDSLLYGFSFHEKADPELRRELNQKSVTELQDILKDRDLPLPNNPQNPRHLVRAIETAGQPSSKASLRKDTIVLGLAVPKSELDHRITQRVDTMLDNGLIEEVQSNVQRYGWDNPGFLEPAYKALKPYINGEIELIEARTELIRQHKQFAKRQRTWFKRNRDIRWVNNKADALHQVDVFTSNYLLQ